MSFNCARPAFGHDAGPPGGEGLPFVSVIIPCRNEVGHIEGCLNSVVASEYPKDRMEVLVIDGMSDDGTREIAGRYSNAYPFIKLRDNPKRITPSALNIGVRNAVGEVIIRMDAHNVYGSRYIPMCVGHLLNSGADNVGGVWVTMPGKDTTVARSIALALSHPFGVGNSSFRIGAKEPAYVDTVPFGCYRREVFERIGLFDEDLVRNQDDEFNLRLIRNGGKIMLVPDIVSHYYARDSLRKLWRMYFQYGYFKPLVASKVGGVMTLRQIVPALFVLALAVPFATGLFYRPSLSLFLLTAALYALANAGVSFRIAKVKGMRHFPGLMASFLTLHLSYGIGYLKGLWDFILARKHIEKKLEDAPITR